MVHNFIAHIFHTFISVVGPTATKLKDEMGRFEDYSIARILFDGDRTN